MLMAGVVGLGAFAALKLVTSKSFSSAEPKEEQMGEVLTMRQGRYYRGRLDLPPSSVQPVLPFNANGSEEDLGRGLVALGFDDVRVYMSTSEVPASWPASVVNIPGPGTRWFQGRWKGPDIQLPRPRQLTRVWSAEDVY
jgi:hypothetical protein